MRISFALCRFLLTSLTCARRKLVTTKMTAADPFLPAAIR